MSNGGLEHWIIAAEDEVAEKGLETISSNKLAAVLSRWQTIQIREMFAAQTQTLLSSQTTPGFRAAVKEKGPWAGLGLSLGAAIVYILEFLHR